MSLYIYTNIYVVRLASSGFECDMTKFLSQYATRIKKLKIISRQSLTMNFI